MDHRAVQEAEFINEKIKLSSEKEILEAVGGKISPEMEPPKLLWLKKNMPGSWKKAEKFMDLADFLTFKASGDDCKDSSNI
jgi:ribulose kinase